jgi:hypothetical protein
METLIIENNYPKYLIECEENKYSSLDFSIFKVNSWSMKNKPIDTEIIFKGSIKWDGDVHLSFIDNSLYLSGFNDIIDFKNILDLVWNKAKNEIKNFDNEISLY